MLKAFSNSLAKKVKMSKPDLYSEDGRTALRQESVALDQDLCLCAARRPLFPWGHTA